MVFLSIPQKQLNLHFIDNLKLLKIYWPHELVLSIRRDEADASLRVELAEAHALVESAVVDGYGLLPTAKRENTSDTHTHTQNMNEHSTSK